MPPITRKDQIITVASQLFREKGYTAVTVRDIAQSMGIKAASLYNHISSKQEILATLILDIARSFTDGMTKIYSENISPVEKIKLLIKLHVDLSVHHPEGMAALNNDWMHLEGSNLLSFIEMRDSYEEHFRKIIKEGIANNTIKPRHPEAILFSILSTLQTLHRWNTKRGKLDLATLKKEMVEVLLMGIV